MMHNFVQRPFPKAVFEDAFVSLSLYFVAFPANRIHEGCQLNGICSWRFHFQQEQSWHEAREALMKISRLLSSHLGTEIRYINPGGLIYLEDPPHPTCAYLFTCSMAPTPFQRIFHMRIFFSVISILKGLSDGGPADSIISSCGSMGG